MSKNQELLKKYPEFFDWVKDKDPKAPIHSIQLGIECGDGWYDLLDSLMESIKGYCSANKIPFIQITQIKEKYGGLRFYYNGGNDIIFGMTWFSEDLSLKTCETCGRPGELRPGNWFVTSCNSCYEGK